MGASWWIVCPCAPIYPHVAGNQQNWNCLDFTYFPTGIELFKLPQIDRAFSATSSRASRLSTILFPDDLGGLPLPSAGAVADFDGAAATQIGDPSRARSSSDLIVNDQVEPCTPNFFIFF